MSKNGVKLKDVEVGHHYWMKYGDEARWVEVEVLEFLKVRTRTSYDSRMTRVRVRRWPCLCSVPDLVSPAKLWYSPPTGAAA